MEKYTPYILGGIALIVIIFLFRQSGSSSSSESSSAPTQIPYYNQIQQGPTDYTYDLAKLQDNFQRTQLSAQLFGLLLNRDLQQKQLDYQNNIAQQQLDLQKLALQQQQSQTSTSNRLMAMSVGVR